MTRALMSIEIIPDEMCPHVEAGNAQRVGGVYFANALPPVSVGMCQDCLDWCNSGFEKMAPLNADAHKMRCLWDDASVIDAEYIDDGTGASA